MFPSPSWSSSLLRQLNHYYVENAILRNVGNYQSSRGNTSEDSNLASHYPSMFLSSFLIYLPHLQYTVRPVSMSQLSFASPNVSAQWPLQLNSVTLLFLPRRPLYRRVSGIVFRQYMSYQLFWIWFLGQTLSVRKLRGNSHEQVTTDTFLLLIQSQFVTEQTASVG
jgi:hypothetical protein